MATIGTFTRDADGAYSGAIKTLSLNVKAVQMRPADKGDPKAPDYRVFANGIEFGAAWKKTSRGEKQYLSVKLDDPSFPRPLFAALVEAEDSYALVWSRARATA